MSQEWTAYVPTLAWTTATPTGLTNVAFQKVKDGTFFFCGYIYGADGAGATALTISVPVIPNKVNVQIPISASQVVNATKTDPCAYVEGTDGTAENRALVKFHNLATCTDDVAIYIRYAGFFEVGADWVTKTVSEQWGAPAHSSPTEVCRTKVIDDVMLYMASWSVSGADTNATTSLTIPPPFVLPDTNTYVSANAHELAGAGGATWSNPLAYVDALHNTGSSRTIQFKSWTTPTDDIANQVHLAAILPVGPWNTFTPSITWGAADPASITKNGIYTEVDGIVFFALYATSADSNACSSPTIALPTECAQVCDIALSCYQLNNATHSMPGAYINADQESVTDRKINFTGFTTCVDGSSVTIYVSGFYPAA